jgi:hypothetical protein
MMKLAITVALAIGASAIAQEQMPCPMHDEHMKQAQTHDHHAGVNGRGDHAMGFSHEKTAHHFRLFSDGGAIDVSVNDPKDTASRDQIRGHLAHIAELFSAGEFDTPMFIHEQVPPGVPVMKERKDRIRYRFESTENGGRVRIATTDTTALAAIHQFLRFQISDHRTGDATTESPSL